MEKIDHRALQFVGGRVSAEPSYAKPAKYYSNPADLDFDLRKKQQGEIMERQTEIEKADQLLVEWYRWTQIYRPNLGVPRVAPYCQQSTTSKQYDDPADLTFDKVYQNEMKAVDYCMDAIAVPMQQAIGAEMRNRVVNARVWRSPGNVEFSTALAAVVVIMRKRGLFD